MTSRMRRVVLAILVALGLATGLQTVPASADVQVDISVFHDRLAPYGQWVEHPRYGWVWYPTGVEAGWRPYTHGHWVWTAEYGWYWDSDYDWGWAPFHYGRWAFDPDYGWFWVPGSVWGPAWVVWRSGGGYVGWAPMPPEAVWQGEVGFGGPEVDVSYTPAWSFCEEELLASPSLVIVPPTRNVTIIRQTINVTNYVTINNRIVNKSIDVHRIEAAAHTHIQPAHVRQSDQPLPSAQRRAAPSEVQVFQPTKKPPQATNKEPTRQQEIINKQQGPAIATPQHQQNPQQPRKPQVPLPTNRDVTRQQEIINKHQGPAIATPQNQQILQQQHETERQKQEEQKRRRQLQCQQNPAACTVP